jgi:hypothetical protein
MVNHSMLASLRVDCSEAHLKRSLFLVRDKVVEFLSQPVNELAAQWHRQLFVIYCD